MLHAHDDHRNVKLGTAVRTVARRKDQYILIIAGSGDCPLSNIGIISTVYVVENNGGYWWEPSEHTALASNRLEK